jgi:hypothetical protein
VPDLPDDQFERYLRQFRPLAPERIQFENRLQPRWPPRGLPAWAAVAAVMIIAFLILYPRVGHQKGHYMQRLDGAQIGASQPLTIRSADALLASAPSFEAAVDALALPSHTTSFGVKQSALDVLSKDSTL